MRLVRKRGRGDCASAALSSYLRVKYSTVLHEAAIVDPEWHGLEGLLQRDVIEIARRLGVTLTPKRRFNLDSDEGVLGIRWNSGERLEMNPEGHFVAVIGGEIICADLGTWRWAEYARRFDCRFCTLLKGVR